jgi:gamma-glutamylcyclotransferase
MKNTCCYLAYGSNLHPQRLYERISSSRLVDVVELAGYRLYFHKRCTSDDSGKCNLVFTGNNEHAALGAVFEMDIQQKPILDTFEGLGYETTSQAMLVAGENREVFWYQATAGFIDDALQPYHWYRKIVLLGAEFHQFPESYRQYLSSIASIDDPDSYRHHNRFDLIARLQGYSHD